CCRLVAGKEKYLVFRDRTADRAAELVALDRVASGREYFSRIEFSVADELEQIAMERVRARFRYQTDGPGRFHARLRARRAGLDLELLQRVRKGHGYVAVVMRIIVVGAVQGVGECRVQSTRDGKTSCRESISPAAIIDGRRRRRSGKRN